MFKIQYSILEGLLDHYGVKLTVKASKSLNSTLLIEYAWTASRPLDTEV